MHPNPAYRHTAPTDALAFARERGFGMLTMNGPDAPLAAHIPFVLSANGQEAQLHLVRSNPIARALTAPRRALLAISGPDGYVSPDWYDLPDQVPTWNYIAVHLRGQIEALPDTALRPHLDALSANFEARLAPKPEWLTAKLPDEALARMMRQIQPFRLRIEDVQSTWKLGQNKPEAARQSAARQMAAHPIGQSAAELAALMQHTQI